MTVTQQRNYQKLAAKAMESHWEIHEGELREKPSMTYRHQDVSVYLGYQLIDQLDRNQFQVRINGGRVSRGDVTYYIPDVFVFPTSMIGPDKDRPDVLEVYDSPVPLVVEVWSPSTGGYDIDEKIPEYQRRGDLEIWRLHPFERTLTAWRRQPDGSYSESVIHGGTVQPVALPNVTVDLDALFE
ncbi:MAG TPA: Uma2 family endonuclease [Thermomicrobiales bacterium]|nr:Uma2 family endonuclease [Thermomicrobiales bacterium]